MQLGHISSSALGAALALSFAASAALATPFTITSTLTGDIRAANPDNLFVNVTITGDDATKTANWVIDINSPLHPDVKLDEFLFNMVGSGSDYSFSNFQPLNWAVSTPSSTQGAGGAVFLFETLDPNGPPDADNVTNSVNLSFLMTYTGAGFLTSTMFTLAPPAVSNEAGSGQLGAHLQSLTKADGNTTDSGFAFGSYTLRPRPPADIPEPGVLFLMGAGLLGLGMARRRKPA